jgi:hypothetical protein
MTSDGFNSEAKTDAIALCEQKTGQLTTVESLHSHKLTSYITVDHYGSRLSIQDAHGG